MLRLPKRTNLGFTLVELLIAVTIIAILSIIAVAVFSGFQKSARDSRRLADINAISSALEAHFNQTPGGGCGGGVVNQYCPLQASFFAASEIPKDPLDGDNNSCGGNICRYCFRSEVGPCNATDPSGFSTPGSSYVVCANLEVGKVGATNISYFCRRNQQGS